MIPTKEILLKLKKYGLNERNTVQQKYYGVQTKAVWLKLKRYGQHKRETGHKPDRLQNEERKNDTPSLFALVFLSSYGSTTDSKRRLTKLALKICPRARPFPTTGSLFSEITQLS